MFVMPAVEFSGTDCAAGHRVADTAFVTPVVVGGGKQSLPGNPEDAKIVALSQPTGQGVANEPQPMRDESAAPA